jgi:hypothetical protein
VDVGYDLAVIGLAEDGIGAEGTSVNGSHYIFLRVLANAVLGPMIIGGLSWGDVTAAGHRSKGDLRVLLADGNSVTIVNGCGSEHARFIAALTIERRPYYFRAHGLRI